MMPYSFGSKRQCQVGGNVSTNAGGLQLLRCVRTLTSQLGD
jgi:FAD/FMN-containing dehydrogenase